VACSGTGPRAARACPRRAVVRLVLPSSRRAAAQGRTGGGQPAGPAAPGLGRCLRRAARPGPATAVAG